MFKIARSILSFVLPSLTALVLLTSNSTAEPFLLRKRLTRADGLPSNTALSIVCDKQGAFWIVTDKGICLYDGQTLHRIRLPESAVKEEDIAQLEEKLTSCVQDSTGALWFGSASGVIRYIPRTGVWKWYRFKAPNAKPLNQITNLCCDQQGTVWIGTRGGLLRYDAQKDSCLIAFQDAPKESVGGVSIDKIGRMWFAFGKTTLTMYHPQHKTYFSAALKEFPDGFFPYQSLGSDGVWISPVSGIKQMLDVPRLVRFDSARRAFSVSPPALRVAPTFLQGIDIYPLAEDEQGHWLVSVRDYAAGRCENGLYRMKPSLTAPLNVGSAANVADSTRFAARAEFAATAENEVFREQILRGTVWALSRNARSGVVCVGVVNQGVTLLIPTGVQRVAEHKRIGDVLSVRTDTKGRNWCGTYFGVFLQQDTGFVAIPFVQEPPPTANMRRSNVQRSKSTSPNTPNRQQAANVKIPVYDIQESASGGICIASAEGIFRFDEQQRTFVPLAALNEAVGKTTVRKIAFDTTHRELWAIIPSLGVVRCQENGTPLGYFPFSKQTNDSSEQYLGVSTIFSLRFDSYGNLWMGGRETLLRWQRQTGRLERLTELPTTSLTFTPFQFLDATPNYLLTLFWGIGLGIIHVSLPSLTDSLLSRFIRLASLNSKLPDTKLSGIGTTDTTLWWTTYSNGVYRAGYIISDTAGLRLTAPRLILPSDINTSTKGNTEDAINQQSERGWNVGAMASDDKGGILFDYFGDLLRADARARAFTDTARVMSVRYFRNDSAMANVPQHGDTLVCSYNGSFSLACAVVSMIRPERHRLEYFLEDVDNLWNSMQDASLRTVRYSSLPPGNYRLFIRTKAQDPTEDQPLYSENVLTLVISVPYPWWRHPITLGLTFVLLASGFSGLGYAVQHKRALQRIQFLAREKEISDLQRLVAEAQMQTLRLQMNPHFLYNVLAEIQLLVNNNDALATHYITIFSKLLGRVLRQAGKDFVAVSDEVSILKQYMMLEELRNAGKMRCYITMMRREDLQTDEESEADNEDYEAEYWQRREIPTFVLQPFIENAIRHGIRGLKDQDWTIRDQGIVSVQMIEENDTLRCIIEDNGVGREEAMRLKALRSQEQHLSIATTITQDRFHLLRTAFGVQVSVTYTDLYDEQGKAAGTQVTIIIPLKVYPAEKHDTNI